MKNDEHLFKISKESLEKSALDLGAYRATVIPTDQIVTDRVFRDMCAANYCGMYGKCHMCPPDVGEIDELMAELKSYSFALVYQTVTSLEDSFDFEGMSEAKKNTVKIALALRELFSKSDISRVLHLGAGGCGVCEVCSKRIGEDCRFPELALPSLEAYGVNVSELAKSAGMKYINGQDTVTYFGAVLFDNIQ